MPPRYLLDTNICIYIRQKRPPGILRRFRSLRPGEAVLSAITYGELRYGAEKSRERERALEILADLITLIPVEPVPVLAGEAYGAIRADLERRGKVIGNNDLWIAAHARASGLVLVTNNEREFRRVPDLKLANWVPDTT
jgi:tRNA(fMet)-specific endonuclease VapC